METRLAWSGKLLDANGRVGKIEADVAEAGIGVLRLEVAERDGRPVLFRGDMTHAEDERGVRFKSSQQLREGRLLELEANLTREEAGRYAQSAMLGSYTVRGGGTELPLTKGVLILWQFR